MKGARNKDCPVRPCPVRIGAGFLACGWHWGMVPEPTKREFKTAVRSHESRRKMVWAVRALASIWTVLDEAGVNMPPDHQPGNVVCGCPACTSNIQRALDALNMGKPLYELLSSRSAA